MPEVPWAVWQRERWEAGGGDAFVYYAVFGRKPDELNIDAVRYRTRSLPEGVELRHFSRTTNAGYIRGMTEGYAWDALCQRDGGLAEQIESSPDCLVIAGTVADPPTLGYLQDVLGLTTYLLDSGGVAVLDLQTWWWFSASTWHERIFDPPVFVPYRHVVILVSAQDDGTGLSWFHTRGMRKFGRPDIDIHNVEVSEQDVVATACNRLIAHQANGGLVAEGQTIRLNDPPWAGVARHGGDVDDVNFNNVHIEVTRLPAA